VTLFDAALRYDLAHLNPLLRNFKLSLNATNLADKEYVATCSGNASCYYGARRSVMANVSYQW
jgi:iron complex outermembrane receptor protein